MLMYQNQSTAVFLRNHSPGCPKHGLPLALVEQSPDSPSPHFSPRGEAKCVRRPSVRGARRSAPPLIKDAYLNSTHGEQAQRSSRGLIACFDRQVVRSAG